MRARRRAIGMTQTTIASKLGVSFQQIQKYENGSNKVAASRLWDIAAILGVPVSHFYDKFEANGTSISPDEMPTTSKPDLKFFRSYMLLPKNLRATIRRMVDQLTIELAK